MGTAAKAGFSGFCAVVFALLPVSPGSAASAGQWLRSYPVPEFAAHWHLDLTVKDFKKGRKRALALLEKYGGKPRLPLENIAQSEELKFQQFSFSIPARKSEELFARLKKLGRVRRAQQKPSEVVDYSVEINRKLDRLRAEREAGGELLRRLASVSEILEEIMARLERSSKGYLNSKDAVLLNIVLEEEPR